jgi:hypothetical protein
MAILSFLFGTWRLQVSFVNITDKATDEIARPSFEQNASVTGEARNKYSIYRGVAAVFKSHVTIRMATDKQGT